MARTAQELAVRVLEELGIIGAGETPSAADADTVKGRYQDLHEQLIDDNYVYWAYSATNAVIPGGAMEGLTMLVADVCAPAFGQLRDRNRELEGKAKLREHSRLRPSREQVAVNYF